MYERIVAGTDLSRTAAIAIERAALLASRVGAKLTLVHAGSHPGDALDELAKQHDAEAIAPSGSPAEVLVSEAERLDAGLIVVGSVGMSGTRRFLLGSVPNKVSHHASCDVLIVKTDPAPPGVSEYETVLVGTDGSPTAMRAVEPGADFEVRSVVGHPAETLISLAGDEGFDLIAVGSVGMRGPKRFMLGNVPQRVSNHAPTDVLILKTA